MDILLCLACTSDSFKRDKPAFRCLIIFGVVFTVALVALVLVLSSGGGSDENTCPIGAALVNFTKSAWENSQNLVVPCGGNGTAAAAAALEQMNFSISTLGFSNFSGGERCVFDCSTDGRTRVDGFFAACPFSLTDLHYTLNGTKWTSCGQQKLWQFLLVDRKLEVSLSRVIFKDHVLNVSQDCSAQSQNQTVAVDSAEQMVLAEILREMVENGANKWIESQSQTQAQINGTKLVNSSSLSSGSSTEAHFKTSLISQRKYC